MSNLAGKAYAMNVLTPIRPRWTRVNQLIFMLARAIPKTLGGLLGLSLIHFARWVVIRRAQWPDLGQGRERLRNDYVLFCSNFNGTWDQYIDAFSDGIPNGLNLFWWGSSRYPKSIPITPFKRYITHNQIGTDYYYNATPGSGQRDIKGALRVLRELTELAEAHTRQEPDEFAGTYARTLLRVQGDLGDPGYAPVASLATERADLHRGALLQAAAGASTH